MLSPNLGMKIELAKIRRLWARVGACLVALVLRLPCFESV